MVDIVDTVTRSRMMAGIKHKNNKLEILLRKSLFSKGLRYRLYVRGLPGKPDLVFPKYDAVVFFHGCFWHGHDCFLFRWPQSNVSFWQKKIQDNRDNDEAKSSQLRALGWRVMVVWECALRAQGEPEVTSIANRAAHWLTCSRSGSKEIRGKIANAVR